ncbi:hypothetical protein ABZ816_19755 [Actinosynnema sp. NPDC047251]|uniref:hypothetical protein n=1 Tax=Saccharothrix espanaensis TaxID=103731 RepID=UPI00031CDFFD|nr:hypothetical protein [Saccharothrix espanaensis]
MTQSKQLPRELRAAGVLTALEGLVGLGFAVLLVLHAVDADQRLVNVLGEAAYFAVLYGGVLAAGIALVLGKHWARTPSIVVQLVLLGVAWYAYGPSGQQLYGALVGVYAVVVIVLLFTNPVRRWALGVDETDE